MVSVETLGDRSLRETSCEDWKRKMPTYDPELFNPRKHSWDKIAQAMCQSELVHETIVMLSFLPIFASIWFGSAWVFIITSMLGAFIDMIFVIMQRYNRPRIIEIIKRKTGDAVRSIPDCR